jgi:SAM-dependent methyltransferase
LTNAELLQIWEAEEARPFVGWDFSYLSGRMTEEVLPWSYMTAAGVLMAKCASALDMGTGGGERILELKALWPERLTVTEAYQPNFELAKSRLEPLGVKVENVSLERTAAMPFPDGCFDLVLNRHSGFNPDEVCRVLARGGRFLTQQVHGLTLEDLLDELGAEPQWPDATPAYYLPRLESGGLSIVGCQEWKGKRAFTDVGAIVYYLKAIPWIVRGFSVLKHASTLLKLHERILKDGKLEFTDRNYLIEAVKGP